MLPENETVENIQAENTPLDTPEIQSESQTQELNTENDTVVEDELSLLKNELEEQKNKYLRLFAEFDNFKKRNAKERLELLKTAGQDVIRDLLPVLDDFQRAAKAFDLDNNSENYANGLKLPPRMPKISITAEPVLATCAVVRASAVMSMPQPVAPKTATSTRMSTPSGSPHFN